MTKIIYFNIAAFAVLTVILINAFFRKTVNGKANRGFLVAVSEVLLAVICGTFAIYFDNLGTGNVGAKWVFHASYLLFHTLTSAFYLYYLISLTDTWHRLRRNTLSAAVVSAPAVVFLVVMVINCFKPVVFYINASDVYTRGDLFPVTYAVGAFYLAYGIYYIFKYKHLFTIKWILTLFAPYPLIAIAMIVEFFLPYTVIELFVNALALVFISGNIQRPEELLDPVTGLYNEDMYETVCRKAFKNGKPMREILVKITNYGKMREMLSFEERARFKEIVASGLKGILKAEKTRSEVYYAGIGRFYVLSEERDYAKTGACAERIYNYLNSPIDSWESDITPETTVCVISVPDDIGDFDSLIAFNHNFEDKFSSGKVLYAATLLEDSRYRIMLDIDRIIESALKKDKFEVYYQPIYSIAERKFTAAEALLRLKDDRYGWISPEIFIPAAEISGAINKIGEAVLEKVCSFISGNVFPSLGVSFIEINLSTVQCMQNDLSGKVRAVLEKYGVPEKTVNLEITETAASQSPEYLMDNLRNLHDSGITISLDDFGSGYSNVQRMSLLPISMVKLDKNFISDKSNERILLMLERMVSMLKELDLKIVAEGVETKEDAERYIKLGCEYIQGFYYAGPLSEPEFIAFTARNNSFPAGI